MTIVLHWWLVPIAIVVAGILIPIFMAARGKPLDLMDIGFPAMEIFFGSIWIACGFAVWHVISR